MHLLTIAHRGSALRHLENTLLGIQNAISQKLDYVEIDFRATKDNQIVAFHDARVEKLTNGRGKVSDLSLAELKKLSYKKNAYRNLWRVPTLEECIDLINSKVGIICEIKGKMSTKLLSRMITYVRQKQSLNRFIMASRSREILKMVKTIDNNVLTGRYGALECIVMPFKKQTLIDYDILMLNELIANNFFINAAKKRGLKVFISTVWGLRSRDKLSALDVDGIFIDIK